MAVSQSTRQLLINAVVSLALGGGSAGGVGRYLLEAQNDKIEQLQLDQMVHIQEDGHKVMIERVKNLEGEVDDLKANLKDNIDGLAQNQKEILDHQRDNERILAQLCSASERCKP